MLVKLLNTNQPSSLFLVPVFTGLLWIPYFLAPISPDPHILTSYVVFFKKDLIADGYSGSVFAFVVTVITGILINRIINNSDLCAKPSYIYAFVYVLLETVLRSNSYFYSWQLSQLLVIGSLWPLLQIYNQRNVIHLAFEVGLLIAVATILYQPSILFVLSIPVFLQVFRTFNWREWLFPIIGFSLIFLFYWTYRLLTNQPFFTYYLFEKFDFQKFYNTHRIELIACGILLFLGLNSYLLGASKANIHARKQRMVFLFVFILTVTLFTLLNYSGFAYAEYFVVMAFASVIIGFYLANTRVKWLAELAFIALVIAQVIKLPVLNNYLFS
jgi:hypothetical protein